MTIDIQWIRHHPDQVRHWQQCRGLQESTVDQVIQHDQASREALHTLRIHRQRFNSIAKELRTDRENVALLQERNELQIIIQQLEEKVNEKKHQVQTLLEALGSPIDNNLLEQYPLLPEESKFSSLTLSSSGSSSHQEQPHWYQTNSLLSTALEFFGQKYSTRHILPDQPCSPLAVSTSSSSSPNFSVPSTAADWKYWVANSVPRKAIYGAKQLPQYTLLQRPQQDNEGTTTLECLAMTAGAMWDSRQIQMELATELQTFYQSLLSDVHSTNTATPTKTPIQMFVLPSTQLEQHELSRILLVIQPLPHSQEELQDCKPCILGWVSNFGDALSRANDIRFRGGGLQESKEFVYWVHATILSPETWHHLTTMIAHGQVGNESNNTNKNNNNKGLPAWAQWNHSTTTKNKGATTTGTTTLLSPPRFTTRLGVSLQTKKNHHSQPSSRRIDLTLASKSAEAVSCPFGFLLV